MRPIPDCRYPIMLHGIVVKIIHVACVIFVISYGMLPKPPLPDASFAAFGANGATSFVGSNGMNEANLDGFPAVGIIRIAFGQSP
jgi:hypothetical protein